MGILKKSVILIALILFFQSPCAFSTDVFQEITENRLNDNFNLSESITDKTYTANQQEFDLENNSAVQIQVEKENQTEIYPKQQPKTLLFNALAQTAKDVYELQVEQIEKPVPLLKDKLTFNFEKGPLDNIHIWSAYQMNFSNTLPERGENLSKFDLGLINVIIDSQFKGKKENFRIMLDPTHRHSHPEFMQPFFQDLYIESTRIPHTKVLVGNSRPGVGVEGAQSPYTLDFINRAQIARNLSNARKFGLRVRGDYSLMDYDTGIYSSCTNFTDFFPGHEFDGWINIKPLGKTDGRFGKIVTGTGLQSGQKHGMSYYQTGAYAGYEYKKFKTKFEYARANGSNGGAGLMRNRSQGFFWTTAYRVTPKLELLTRFDQYDADRYQRNNNQREYTLGTNYYIKGQALKLIFNYIYCQNDNKVDSHRLMVGTQIIL